MDRFPTRGGRAIFAVVLLALLAAMVVAACSASVPTPAPTSTPFPSVSPMSSPVGSGTSTPAPSPTGEPAPSPAATPTATPMATTPVATMSPSPVPTVLPTTQPAPSPEVPEEIRAKLLKIEEAVSKERQLPIKGASEPMFLTRQELDARYQKQLEDSGYLSDMADVQDILMLFGVLKKGQDLAKLNAQLQGENILGFFDLTSGELVIVGDSQKFGGIEEMTFAHEFTHQLQQQHFDIRTLGEGIRDNSEASAGLDALIEGDATLSMFNYILRQYSATEFQKFIEEQPATVRDMPQFLVRSMQFPYQEGFQFVGSLFQEGGWKTVDLAYQAPPVSTEQVMHPEKYRKGEKPINVEFPDVAAALAGGWQQRRVDAIGEFDLKLILNEQLGENESARAAAGWGGDKFAFLKGPNGELLLVSLIAWDTQKDAGEFFVAYEAWLRKQGVQPEKKGFALSWSLEGRQSLLRMQGDKTLLILAPDGDNLERVAALFPNL